MNNSFDIILVFCSNITVNRYGETARTFVVQTTDSSHGGTYTFLVSISSLTSEESIGLEIIAIGIQIILYYTCINVYYDNTNLNFILISILTDRQRTKTNPRNISLNKDIRLFLDQQRYESYHHLY